MLLKNELVLISHGAEAKIYEHTKTNTIYKYRLPKSYRIKELDDYLIKKRTKSEIRILGELNSKKVNVPKLKDFKNSEKLLLEDMLDTCNLDSEDISRKFNRKNTIVMDKITGDSLKVYIEKNINQEKVLENIFSEFGKLIKQIHELNIVHGDITTMNFIVKNTESELALFAIDFGLSITSKKVEDKAVDLYVFEKSLKCDYSDDMYEKFLKWFYQSYKDEDILKRLEKVRLRGRKREENAIG